MSACTPDRAGGNRPRSWWWLMRGGKRSKGAEECGATPALYSVCTYRRLGAHPTSAVRSACRGCCGSIFERPRLMLGPGVMHACMHTQVSSGLRERLRVSARVSSSTRLVLGGRLPATVLHAAALVAVAVWCRACVLPSLPVLASRRACLALGGVAPLNGASQGSCLCASEQGHGL